MDEKVFWLTGPRVALLSAVTMASMFSLLYFAEMPLFSDLQVAVALRKALPQAPLPKDCEKSTLSSLTAPLASFDERKSGYSRGDALNILCAMEMNGEAGKRAYLNRHFPLDMVFLLLYGPALAVLWLYLICDYRWIPKGIRYFAVIPILASVLDFAENMMVRTLVLEGPPGNETLIGLASRLTETKHIFASIGIYTTIVLLLFFLIQHSINRQVTTN